MRAIFIAMKASGFVANATECHTKTTFKPGTRLDKLGQCFHFGQNSHYDSSRKCNYLACNTHVSLNLCQDTSLLLLFFIFEMGQTTKHIFDVCLSLREAPSRIIGASRLVTAGATQSYALPPSFIDGTERLISSPQPKPSGFQIAWMFFAWLVLRPFALFLRSLINRSPAKELNQRGITVEVDEAVLTPQISSTDPIEEALNELLQCLNGIVVPAKREKEVVSFDSVLGLWTRSDLRRFLIGSDCQVKVAAVRLVQTSAWRAQALPVDTRICRVELRNGQFYHQGKDKDGCRVFYCWHKYPGKWRRDYASSLAAILYQLEALSWKDGEKLTLVIPLGNPLSPNATGNSSRNLRVTSHRRPFVEQFDIGLIRYVLPVVGQHYPEILHRCLVVFEGANENLLTHMHVRKVVNGLFRSQTARSRIHFLSYFSDLQEYIEKKELVIPAGGTAAVVGPSVDLL